MTGSHCLPPVPSQHLELPPHHPGSLSLSHLQKTNRKDTEVKEDSEITLWEFIFYVSALLSPGTLAMQRTCELHTKKLSKMFPGWLASMTIALVVDLVLVQIQTREDSSS